MPFAHLFTTLAQQEAIEVTFFDLQDKLLLNTACQCLTNIRVKGRGNAVKGALNPNFLNLIINREKFWLEKRLGPIS